MPRLTIAELEGRIYKAYPTFIQPEFNVTDRIRRWGVMNITNILGAWDTIPEALEEAVQTIRSKGELK